MWTEYPGSKGNRRKAEAAYRRTLAAGANADDLLSATINYAGWCGAQVVDEPPSSHQTSSTATRSGATGSMSPSNRSARDGELPRDTGRFHRSPPRLDYLPAVPPPLGMPEDVAARYVWHEWRNAIAVLRGAYPDEWDDLLGVLQSFRLRRSWIEEAGGNRSQIARALDEHFATRGWRETRFDTRVTVQHDPNQDHPEPVEYDSPTHKVDSSKNHVGVEVEWNNKDTFFDRDLNNFPPAVRPPGHRRRRHHHPRRGHQAACGLPRPGGHDLWRHQHSLGHPRAKNGGRRRRRLPRAGLRDHGEDA